MRNCHEVLGQSHVHDSRENMTGFLFVLSEYAGKLEPLSLDEEMALTEATSSKISKQIPPWLTSVFGSRDTGSSRGVVSMSSVHRATNACSHILMFPRIQACRMEAPASLGGGKNSPPLIMPF